MKKLYLSAVLATAAFGSLLPAVQADDHDVEYAMAIHGGAGTITRANLTAEQEQAYKDKLTEALEAGRKVLKEGGDSTTAVVAAIQGNGGVTTV